MEKFNYNGKTKEEAIEIAISKLNVNETDIIVRDLDIKSGLFKSKKIEIEVIKKDDVVGFIKEKIDKFIKLMGIDANYEIKKREDNATITIFSDNNNILIGKQGRTIDALTTIIKQIVHNELGCYYNFIIDVGEYKVKQQKNLERLAKDIAREVARTKIEVKLDPMNSYERRIVHSILTDNTRVKTESIGENPNRCVVIKPVDD